MNIFSLFLFLFFWGGDKVVFAEAAAEKCSQQPDRVLTPGVLLHLPSLQMHTGTFT